MPGLFVQTMSLMSKPAFLLGVWHFSPCSAKYPRDQSPRNSCTLVSMIFPGRQHFVCVIITQCQGDLQVPCVTQLGEDPGSLLLVSSKLHPTCLFPLLILLLMSHNHKNNYMQSLTVIPENHQTWG